MAAVLLLIPGALAASTKQPAEVSRVVLLGVIEQAGGGIALLRIGAFRPRALRVGESHRGFRLREVWSDRVVLESPAGETRELGFPEPAVAPPPARPARKAAAAPSPSPAHPEPAPGPEPRPPGGAAPAETPADRFFSRDEVRLRLQSELPRILTSSAVVPRVRGTEVEGLELVAFPMDTLLGETGLLPGDVLLRVNGREVRGAESLAVLVQRFQTANEVELEVDRGGELLSLRYRIE